MDRIKSLSPRVAHTVLLALCNDPSILRRASQFLDLLEAPSPSEYEESDELEQSSPAAAAPPAPPAAPSRKRKAPPAAETPVCERCEQPFNEEDNHASACQFHDGWLEPDYDGGFWDDYSEPSSGPIDTDENRAMYPEAFFWDCCGKKGDEGCGCQSDWHMVTISGTGGVDSKRGRFGEDAPPLASGGEGDDDEVVISPPSHKSPEEDDTEDSEVEELVGIGIGPYEIVDDAVEELEDEDEGEDEDEEEGEENSKADVDEEVTQYYEVEVIDIEDEDEGPNASDGNDDDSGDKANAADIPRIVDESETAGPRAESLTLGEEAEDDDR